MKYRIFWIYGEFNDIFNMIVKWASLNNYDYEYDSKASRIIILSRGSRVGRRLLEALFGGLARAPVRMALADITILDYRDNIKKVVIRYEQENARVADALHTLLIEAFPLKGMIGSK